MQFPKIQDSKGAKKKKLSYLHKKLYTVEWRGDSFSGGTGNCPGGEESGFFRNQCNHSQWMLQNLIERGRELLLLPLLGERNTREIRPSAIAVPSQPSGFALVEAAGMVRVEARDFPPSQCSSRILTHFSNRGFRHRFPLLR